jgi:phosphatidylserine/phosphatidylglycerophosphate/cardiolipin synthase-like enzyme
MEYANSERIVLRWHHRLNTVTTESEHMKMKFVKIVSAGVFIIFFAGFTRSKPQPPSKDFSKLTEAPTPRDQEVCFSPEGNCDAKLVQLVRSAKTSIDIAIYDINLEPLVQELVTQSKKIPVRMIVDQRQSKEANSSVPALINLGVNIRYGHQRGIFHNKFMIVDGKMIETGSFNYTHNAAQNNNENQVYLAIPVIVESYAKRFEELWKAALPIER